MYNFIFLLKLFYIFFVLELPQPVGLYPLNEDTLKDMVSKKIEIKNADVTKGPGGEFDSLFIHLFYF